MKKNFWQATSLLLVGGLMLSGCASLTESEEGEGNNPTNNSATLSYPEKWNNPELKELLFPRGEYSFTYKENNTVKGISSWSGDGVIAFYENGTCAFDFSGTKKSISGETEKYRLGKFANESPVLKQAGNDYWTNDQLQIESDYRTNFPTMGAFPRYRDYASFCSLQMLQDLTTKGEATLGSVRWSIEEGAKFAAKGKEWFIDYNLHYLDIADKDKAEATEILELMYYAPDNIFTHDGEAKVDVKKNGTIVITTGVKGKTEVYSEFTLTPLAKKLLLDLNEGSDSEPANIEETLSGYVTYYEGGIKYLRKVETDYKNAPKSTPEEKPSN